MLTRRSLSLPIILGTTMIVLIVVLTIGWVLMSVFGARAENGPSSFFLTLLPLGILLLLLVLAGVVMYLVLSIKAINLSRRQSNFIDSVTHELKSPIASLKLYLQTLNRRQLSEQEKERFYRAMLEDVERLDGLIDHLLDAARIDKRDVRGEITNVPLDELLQACGKIVLSRHRLPDDTMQFDLQPCTVRAVRGDLEVLFRNLFDNAAKYAGEVPRVEVKLRPESDGHVTVRIADNGRGIPTEMRRRIFARFERLGLELERQKPGTGLGLFIVDNLVRRLKGRVRVVDSAAGGGAVFEVRLPGLPREVEAAVDSPPALDAAS